MSPRVFHVLHSLGIETILAPDAATALKLARVPRGYLEAFGVIEDSIIARSREAHVGASYVGFIGAPAAESEESL